jgi:ATP-dependent Clp protease ATP-binding subunit ClpA
LLLEITPAAKDVLLAEGYDPNYGARPMRRAIQRLIQDPLSLKLLASEYLTGDTIFVDADAEPGKLKFSKQTAAVVPESELVESHA